MFLAVGGCTFIPPNFPFSCLESSHPPSHSLSATNIDLAYPYLRSVQLNGGLPVPNHRSAIQAAQQSWEIGEHPIRMKEKQVNLLCTHCCDPSKAQCGRLILGFPQAKAG